MGLGRGGSMPLLPGLLAASCFGAAALAVQTQHGDLESLVRPKNFSRNACELMVGMCSFGRKGLACLPCRITKLWEQARVEENVSFRSISDFSWEVPKMPRSWIQRIEQLNHTRHRRFNFVGALYRRCHHKHSKARRRRAWMEPLVQRYFSKDDIFTVVDDVECDPPNRTRSKDADFDQQYFEALASSQFTLCPGGDNPWSIRMYEAIASGSIPVLRNATEDFSEGAAQNMRALASIGYHYVLLEQGNESAMAEIKYRRDWADENMALFLKYQTFIQGDNVPSAYQHIGL